MCAMSETIPSWITSGYNRTGLLLLLQSPETYRTMVESLPPAQREDYRMISENLSDASSYEQEAFKLVLAEVMGHVLRAAADSRAIDKVREIVAEKITDNPEYDWFRAASIHGRFEQIVNRYSDRVAVKSDSRTVTYGELNSMANRIASSLLSELGEGSEPIGLVFRLRGAVAMIAAHLGVLKAGKICLGLNAALPIDNILREVNPRLIISDSENLDVAHRVNAARVWNIDDPKRSDGSDQNPNIGGSLDNVAYWIFTSGSTGIPKGAIHIHRGDVTLARNMGKLNKLTPADRISMLRYSSAGYNDMFASLLNGATLTTCDPFAKTGPASLADWVNEEGVTYLKIVATAYRFIVCDGKKFPAVRVVDIGGEVIDPGDVELYKKQFSDDCIFASRYGCTETRTVSYYLINKNTAIGDRVPVGFPLEHNEILILDDDRRPLASGDVGEIGVKSACLALGYWNEPKLTQEKFFTGPDDKTKRIYLTRDLGYKREDGCLMHLGRKDFQGAAKAKFSAPSS
jgi:non-ribosomal peptide synthetase component F